MPLPQKYGCLCSQCGTTFDNADKGSQGEVKRMKVRIEGGRVRKEGSLVLCDGVIWTAFSPV